MQDVNHHPPEKMTIEQRRSEVAQLIARAVVRMRTQPVAKSANVADKSEFSLGFSAKGSVHTDPKQTSSES